MKFGYKFERGSKFAETEEVVDCYKFFEPMAQNLRITEEVVGNCLSGERKGD